MHSTKRPGRPGFQWLATGGKQDGPSRELAMRGDYLRRDSTDARISSSFDFTFQSQKPAISSFVSGKGPSVTMRFSPENLTRAPFELGWSPSPASSTPALASSSLYFPMAASNFSSGRIPASESLVA